MIIKHEQDHCRFVVEDQVGDSILAYRTSLDEDQKRIDFYRTYVPPSLRSKGIAESLVRKGIAWAKEEGYIMSASCWYAAKFLA